MLNQSLDNKPSDAMQTMADSEATLLDDSSPAPSLKVGSVLKSTLELVEILGEGGMGTVYKAVNKVWEEVEARNPYIAVKLLKPEFSQNKQLVRSLYSDFDRTKMLANCPNIVNVYGFDRDGAQVYMTMEYLQGQTLADYLKQMNRYVKQTPVSLAQVWFIIEGIGNALAYAHQHNIVHRDVKPANIIITRDNQVKVLDFGIAAKINEIEGDETKFSGHHLGALTPAYASPEMQCDFPPDVRDDIYAFACIIYEILTGQQFFKQKIRKALPIIGLNRQQMTVLNKGLAFERTQRVASIDELLNKLKPVKSPRAAYRYFFAGLVIASLTIFYITTPPPPPTHQPPKNLKGVEELINELTLFTAEELIPQEEFDIDWSKLLIKNLKTSKTRYKKGDSFKLSVELTVPCYLRVIDFDAQGVIKLLYPIDKDKKQVKLFTYPPEEYRAYPEQIGKSTITVIASKTPFPKKMRFLEENGDVSEEVKAAGYDWQQINYDVTK